MPQNIHVKSTAIALNSYVDHDASRSTYRLQNSPYFCVFKYARAVKQKVWNEAENGRVRFARFARVRLLRHALPISLVILRKKPTVLQSSALIGVL